jgi:monoterpene epsilon-lactone hydrolase
MLKWFFKSMMSFMASASAERVVKLQPKAAGQLPDQSCGLPVSHQVVNGIPGAAIGALNDHSQLLILHLHGGGFIFPASPPLHVELLGRLCSELNADGFLPDYRLAPLHTAPAALDDCERAYRGLLELGFAAERIVLIGDSAGGNLVLGLLQRIRKAALPMPACAVPISAVTELGDLDALPSRVFNAKREALLPRALAARMTQWYVGKHDTTDPEISPLHADYTGFPPLYFIVGEREVLLDDSVFAARRAREAGVETQLDVWPVLPHAFLLFEAKFSEAPQARRDIVTFVRRHVKGSEHSVKPAT